MEAGSGNKTEAEAPKQLTRKEILETKDFRLEPVEVPEWGGVVYVKTMSGEERDRFEDELIKRRDDKTGIPSSVVGLKVLIVSLTACDAEGKRLFGGDGDEKKLAAKSAAAIDRLWEVAQKMSHLSDEAVEELTEDFTKGRSASSGSS